MINDHIQQLYAAFRTVPKPLPGEGDTLGLDANEEQIKKLLDADQPQMKADDFRGFIGYNSSPEQIRFLFPAIAEIWHEEIYKPQSWFAEHLNRDLAKYDFVFRYLSSELADAVLNFTRWALLSRIGSEQSLIIEGYTTSHRWPAILASYGVWTDDIESVWPQLWKAESLGHTIAVVQYASCLVCSDDNNPVFRPHSSDRGGGPPLLCTVKSNAPLSTIEVSTI